MENNENNGSVKFFFERMAFLNVIDLMLVESEDSLTYDVLYFEKDFARENRRAILVPKEEIQGETNAMIAAEIFDYLRKNRPELFL